MEEDETLWTASDVAKYLKLCTKTIYTKAYKGEIPSVKFGRSLRFKPSVIKKLVKRKKNSDETSI